MKEMVLNCIREYGETNPTHTYMMGKLFNRIPQETTYEDVDNAFNELSQEGLIIKTSQVNYNIK